MEIVAIANHKGGVGKTTTTANLASALGERGHRVLVVDCDPQASLTSMMGFELGAEDLQLAHLLRPQHRARPTSGSCPPSSSSPTSSPSSPPRASSTTTCSTACSGATRPSSPMSCSTRRPGWGCSPA